MGTLTFEIYEAPPTGFLTVFKFRLLLDGVPYDDEYRRIAGGYRTPEKAELAAKQAIEFYAERGGPSKPELWVECEHCGCGVAPRAKALGVIPIHGDCWSQLTPKQRELAAKDHNVSYLASEEG